MLYFVTKYDIKNVIDWASPEIPTLGSTQSGSNPDT
jgi:hypothetical protein